MARFDEERLRALERQLRRDDPRFVRALETGRPCRPREYRHGRAWLLLTVALTVLGLGIALGDGLLIATGLVLAGGFGNLWEAPRPPGR